MKIDKKIVQEIKQDAKKFKGQQFNENNKLKKEFYTSLKLYEEDLTKNDAYTNALWIDSNQKQLASKNKVNKEKYKLGQIVLVDLGWNTYDREFAFIHPAIVIKQTYDKIFIVPCTSGKPRVDKKGNIYKDFMLGTIQDGFEKDTVIMLYEAKYVDKNRVISLLGTVEKEFFDKLYNKLFEQLFEAKAHKIKVIEQKLKQYEDE